MKSQRKKVRLVFLVLVTVGGLLVGYLQMGRQTYLVAHAETIEELREQLNAKRKNLKDVEDRINKFKDEVQLKRSEARTLREQIDIIDDNITRLELRLEQTVAEIETTSIEIKAVKQEIEEAEREIARQKGLLAEYIRAIYALNTQSSVTVFLKYQTFSEAMSETLTIRELQARGQQTLTVIKGLKEELEAKRDDLEDIKQALEKLQLRQEQQQATLTSNREAKDNILDLTQAQEAQFQELLQEAKQAHQQSESDIKRLDEKIREELRKQGIGALPSVGIFDWPVEPIFGISCEFHCPDYPYTYLIGPHAGIDIPTYIGTPIMAPADGYVGRLHDAGGAGYSYILFLHGDDISTVYGHVSGFAVKEGQLVTRGTVLGYSGGAPGMRGAGLSSGPHLHFEVRKNNTPINPRGYL